MENLHDLLVARRSIRKYTDAPLDAEDVKLILEAALLSPTSKSSRAWQLVVVDDKEMLSRLADCKPAGAVSVSRCAMAVIVGVDPTKTEPWIEDASVAATMMQLQASDLGIGSCWIQIRDRYMADGTPSQEYIQELLGIPDTIPIVCMITFGYPDEVRKPQNIDNLRWENIHIDKWA